MLNVGNPSATDIHDHYTVRYDKATRLGSTLKGRLERARVRDVLSWYLPAPPAAVVDVGGGPGVHAAWLQSLGYTEELLDPVQTHVKQAAEAGISSVVDDARRLPWPDGSFDAALLAGPLYHLIEATDRRLAWPTGTARETIGWPVPTPTLSTSCTPS